MADSLKKSYKLYLLRCFLFLIKLTLIEWFVLFEAHYIKHVTTAQHCFFLNQRTAGTRRRTGSIDFFHICWVVHRPAFTRIDRSLATANSDACCALRREGDQGNKNKALSPSRPQLEIAFT